MERLWFGSDSTDLFFPRRAARALLEQETLDGAVEGLLGLLGWVCWCHFGCGGGVVLVDRGCGSLRKDRRSDE